MTAKPLLILCAQSLRRISPDEILSGFDDELKRRDRKTVSLDFTNFVTQGSFTEAEQAVRQLTAPEGNFLCALAQSHESELVFHGLAHIPLLVLMGHLVTDRAPVRLFDYNRNVDSCSWRWSNDEQDFPPTYSMSLVV